MNLTRNPGELEEEYIYRICSLKSDIGYWDDVAKIINDELGYEYTESKYRKQFAAYQKMFSTVNEGRNCQVDDSRIDAKERWKLQTEKLEYNKWLRENARDELFVEKIVSAIRELAPLSPPEERYDSGFDDNRFAILFGDEHYGVEFTIRGLRGEVINQYSPEIFESRMWELLDNICTIVDKEGIRTLSVFSMGDVIDGALRVGQLMKLRYGVVDSTVRYMEFISTWLNELTKVVRVRFHMVDGNHSEIRMFNQPKGAFKDDNMGKIVSAYIKARLQGNTEFEMCENPTGLIFETLCGYNILGVHGEMKDMEKSIKDFSNTYNTSVDYLVGGHLHHGAYECTGVNKGVIRVPSIIGIDDFSMRLNKTSNPGATMVGFTPGKGKTIEYNISL